MTAHVQKWGNSLALRLPKALAAEAHLAQGSLVSLTLDGQTLRVEAVAAPAPTLDSLLAAVTDDNIHEADGAADGADDGVGRELW